jgi:DNA-binding transcriptional MerR regulator
MSAVVQADRTEDGTALSVEELSARSGAPVRTIREYQTWRILHPPTRSGRRAFYDESHVERLAGIARLQDRGYSIAAIRDLFDAWEQGAELRDVLGVDDAIGPPADEAPVLLGADQLAALLPAIAASGRLTARAVRCGLLDRHPDGFAARSPALVQIVADALRAGVAPTAALDLAAAIVAAADTIGDAAARTVTAAFDQGAGHEVEPLLRRGRMLLARAAATHTIDRAGYHLQRRAGDGRPALAALVEDMRIGTLARPLDR